MLDKLVRKLEFVYWTIRVWLFITERVNAQQIYVALNIPDLIMYESLTWLTNNHLIIDLSQGCVRYHTQMIYSRSITWSYGPLWHGINAWEIQVFKVVFQWWYVPCPKFLHGITIYKFHAFVAY